MGCSDSLLKAGYMGTTLVMSEASYLDSGEAASSVDTNISLTADDSLDMNNLRRTGGVTRWEQEALSQLAALAKGAAALTVLG